MNKSLLFMLFITPSVFAKGVDFQLDGVSLPKSVNFIYSQVFKRPFMLAPEVITDSRLVSFHITEDQDARDFFTRYLQNMNIGVSSKNGVDYIYNLPVIEKKTPKNSYVYQPKYRSVAYLASVLASIVPEGKFGVSDNRAGTVNNALTVQNGFNVSTPGDVLVFYGTSEDIQRLQQVIPSVDIPSDEIYVGGYVYEVQTTERNGSGLAIAAKLLNQRFSIQIGSSGSNASMDNFVKFSSGNLNALYELFNTDSRFRVVSSPSLRARSGSTASFSVGSDVPVISNVTFQGQNAVQSVEYRSSGVIFNVFPEVRAQIIDLTISQELSSFAKTDTGVNNSPTLMKRNIQTSVSVNDGDIILIGGLADNKSTDQNTGLSFLPSVFSTKGSEQSKTDIVVVLQAKKVKR
ncbi:type II secretion system protein GspD [Pectobacterium brasiliense]|uniref:Type II secretion system protein GspD n=1 Tax=Pectobacterium brasiliense TaxID=180957 RepID=A0AAW9GX74_9GAMM|nr:type II secretion system protein GspD [Pectobacterium brasiliense]MDY4376406.1 type II secretion system protein GspD [Pectobacterium brasiliense]MDY4379062.1 type II secretion system protein GspD [Pectobacterium brasiliense]